MNNIQNFLPQSSEQNESLKQQYNNLKQKVANLEKSNLEMIEIYKAEEDRLIKSNEFLMKKKNLGHTKTIQELESDVLKMRNSIQQLKLLIEQKNYSNPNLIENSDLISNDASQNGINYSIEKKAKEEYLKNYKNKLKTEFEKNLLSKHKDLVNFYIERNNKIKQDENKGKEEDLMNIDEIKFFSLKENSEDKVEIPKDKNTNKKNNNLEDLIKNIIENDSNENKDINIDTINKLISLLCLKEEYPKEFFIDYILDEAFAGNNQNQDDSFSKLLELEKEAGQKPKSEIQKFIQKKPRRKSVFHISAGYSTNKVLNKICKLFEIKNDDDVECIKNYLNKIMLSNNHNLRHYFEKNLVKYRFAPYEQTEKENYDKKLKSLFEKDILKIQNLLNFDNNIITFDLLEEFNKKYLSSNDLNEEISYYMMSLMKLTKKEKKEQKNKRVKSLGLFEFYLLPLFQIVNN